MKQKLTPNQDLAKKSGGTYFFSHAKIPNFSSKTQQILRIQASNEYKLIRRPILHPKASTWSTVTKAGQFLWIYDPKTFFKGIYQGLNLITYFLNYNQTKEVRTIILGLKLFANIVEEARGANSNFKILVCSSLGWLSRTASLNRTLCLIEIRE